MKIQSELMNAVKKLTTLEAQLERTLLQLARQEYGIHSSDLTSDVRFAKDKIIDAREALEGRIL